jgi:hypothetical protein
MLTLSELENYKNSSTQKPDDLVNNKHIAAVLLE